MPLSEDIVRELRQSVEVRQMHGARTPTSLEWWYFTGHLWKIQKGESCDDWAQKLDGTAKQNPDYGIQATFFLSDAGPEKGTLAHAAHSILAEKRHAHSELFAPVGTGSAPFPLAFSESGFLNIALAHWRLNQLSANQNFLNWDLRFDVKGTEYLLQLDVPKKKIWFHGKDGYLKKTKSSGNFYYSIPFIRARGVRLAQSRNAGSSENVCGQLWFDHEIHVENVMDVSWKWFGLSFSNQKSLMLYQVSTQSDAGKPEGELWDDKTGRTYPLQNITLEPRDVACLQKNRCYPQSFVFSFRNPQSGKKEWVETRAFFPEQELAGGNSGLSRVYWEASTSALWTEDTKPQNKRRKIADGLGYTELVPQVSEKINR